MSFWKKPAESAEWLSQVAFFEGFTPDELQRVAALSGELSVPKGTRLMDQGEVGTECYVIVEGSASIYVRGQHVASVSAGSMVGEMSLIEHGPRVAAVVADTDMRLLRFHLPQFRSLLAEMPKAEERVMALLTARVRSDQD